MPPWKLSREAMLTIFPGALRAIMSRAASCESWKTLVRLTCRTCCQSSRETSSAAARAMVPALLMRMSTRPSLSSTCEKSDSAPEVEERSAWQATAWPPAEVMAAAVSAAGRRLPWTATVAPAWARAVAMAAPRPLAAPVTRATLWSRRKRSRTDCGVFCMVLPLYRALQEGANRRCESFCAAQCTGDVAERPFWLVATARCEG